jgi:predicted P-loop ATPase
MLTTNWIVELAEVDKAVRRYDAETLKAFITRPIDETRTPYARKAERHYRRTAYAGTTNQVDGFLVDPTGNRRWWVVPVTSCDVTGLQALNLQQLWAQAWAEWQAAPAAHVLIGQELAENDALNLAHNRDRTPEEQALLDAFDPAAPVKLHQYSATEVCKLLELDLQRSAAKMGHALARHFQKKKTATRVFYLLPDKRGGNRRPNYTD